MGELEDKKNQNLRKEDSDPNRQKLVSRVLKEERISTLKCSTELTTFEKHKISYRVFFNTVNEEFHFFD